MNAEPTPTGVLQGALTRLLAAHREVAPIAGELVALRGQYTETTRQDQLNILIRRFEALGPDMIYLARALIDLLPEEEKSSEIARAWSNVGFTKA